MKNHSETSLNKSISVEELFNAEIFKSERRRSIILVWLLGIEAFFLLVLHFFYNEEYISIFKTHTAIYAILIFATTLILYESLVHFLLGKGSKRSVLNPRIFGYFNSFSEVTLLSLLLIFIVEYSGQTIILQAPATLTYFIFIVLSTFRLNFRLSVFTGSLAALEFILVSAYYSNHLISGQPGRNYPTLLEMQYLGQGLIMVITGIGSGFVTKLIKQKMIMAWHSIKEKNEIIDLFGQQISPQIAENILKKQDELSGARKKVCIMFLDIRQFTPFVEQHQPEEVVAYLNNLFSFMIDIVQSHHGVINQFLGDGFMATFGAPVSVSNSSQHATEAAREIIKQLNIEHMKNRIPKTQIGIGLHYDEAVTGNIGSSVRKQYSITGKVVIMASRIEQLNKKYGTQLLISQEVYDQLQPDIRLFFTWIENTTVKGSKKLVSLYKYVNGEKTEKNHGHSEKQD